MLLDKKKVAGVTNTDSPQMLEVKRRCGGFVVDLKAV